MVEVGLTKPVGQRVIVASIRSKRLAQRADEDAIETVRHLSGLFGRRLSRGHCEEDEGTQDHVPSEALAELAAK